MAARGTRNMDTGEQTWNEASLVMRVRQKARRVNLYALIMAAGLTLLALLV